MENTGSEMMKIPITMCHGMDEVYSPDKPLTPDTFDALISIASELGFESIDYNQLDHWRAGHGRLPERPIMFDLDHPVRSIRYGIHEVLARYGFAGNLFINTGPLDPSNAEQRAIYGDCMTWEQIGELVAAGWHVGAHTVNHPNLSVLSLEDPSGDRLREELAACDETIEKYLGIKPRDFAFTGTSFSSIAKAEVARRYRFGRLWIVGSIYQVDGREVRYAELVGVPGDDDADGGPPRAARYITRDTDPYLLPSMELQALIYEPAAFRRYLEGALER